MYSWRVPLTAGGELKVVPSADLGGLGAKEGASVSYNWVAPSFIPALLPWVAILLLLVLLRRNRRAQAWWILVPLGCLTGLIYGLLPWLALQGFLPVQVNELLVEPLAAIGFGLAAVWLLSAYIGGKHRFLMLLGAWGVLSGFSLLAFLSRQTLDGFFPEGVAMAVALLAGDFILAVALSLAGLACRGRYGPVRLVLWLVAALVVLWVVVAAPFFIIALFSSSMPSPVLEFLAPVLIAAAVSFALLLPFLVLSFASGLYRERLRDLLRLRPAEQPPVVAPPPVLAAA